jgi:hypothetical protein
LSYQFGGENKGFYRETRHFFAQRKLSLQPEEINSNSFSGNSMVQVSEQKLRLLATLIDGKHRCATLNAFILRQSYSVRKLLTGFTKAALTL